MIRLTGPEKIGEALRGMRYVLGLTQHEMAALVGTSQGRYSEHESGKVIPDLVTLIRIFGNLDFDLVLMTRPEEPGEETDGDHQPPDQGRQDPGGGADQEAPGSRRPA